jgi:hypothetical protein
LIRPAAAVLAASLPVGVPVATVAVALEVLEVVAVTMIYAASFYLMKLNKFN